MSTNDLPDDQRLIELQRFQVLVSAIRGYAIYVLDSDGFVVSWKGYSEEDVIGTHF
jgi:hypothetical protein